MSYNHSDHVISDQILGQIVSRSMCDTACYHDARVLERQENIKSYVASNSDQYYICVNTWVSLTQDIMGDEAAFALEETILRAGLLKTIALCSTLANNLIARLDGSKEQEQLPEWAMPLAYTLLRKDDDKETLQVLRFPKRFTLLSSKALKDSSLEAFESILTRNNWRKVARLEYANYLNRDPQVSPPDFGFMGELVRKYTHKILASFDPIEADQFPLKFSSGVCRSSNGKTLRGIVQKMEEVNHYWHFFDYPLYPMPDTLCDINKEEYIPIVEATAVPKSHKTYRVITPEDVMRALAMQRCRAELEATFQRCPYSKLYIKESQAANCDKAKSGSVDGRYATIDLSSASDSISRHLARFLLPEHVWDYLSPWLPTKIKVGEKTLTCSIFLTSGDPCTFDFESIIFLACALAARELHHIWCNKWVAFPQIYGDDIIVDTNSVDELLSILSRLGFIYNEDKSFWSGGYRESCGVEYYMGYDVSTAYWPRKGLRFTGVNDNYRTQTLASLVSLQHRLYDYPRAARFLKNLVLSEIPNMTFSPVGTDCTDLWGPISFAKPRTAPFDRTKLSVEELRDKYGEVVMREGHLTLQQKGDPEFALNPYAQLYAYYTFLAQGPDYPDDLSRLLRVSNSRLNGVSPDSPVKWGMSTR